MPEYFKIRRILQGIDNNQIVIIFSAAQWLFIRKKTAAIYLRTRPIRDVFCFTNFESCNQSVKTFFSIQVHNSTYMPDFSSCKNMYDLAFLITLKPDKKNPRYILTVQGTWKSTKLDSLGWDVGELSGPGLGKILYPKMFHISAVSLLHSWIKSRGFHYV